MSPHLCSMEEEQEFKQFAAQPDVQQRLFSKIAPQIFGHEDIKKAVACLLFGGARKVGQGMRQVRHKVFHKLAEAPRFSTLSRYGIRSSGGWAERHTGHARALCLRWAVRARTGGLPLLSFLLLGKARQVGSLTAPLMCHLDSTCGLCPVLGRARRAVQAGRMQEGLPLLVAQGSHLLPTQSVRQRSKVVPHCLAGRKG